jgi:pyruvate/2-oxoglutarate dehydrogenase complex dihydrolipoamide acyltransferase (E2) component
MHEIRIPKSGMSTVEVDITELFVEVGQSVAIGDSIADIDTEKVTMTLEADVAGTVTQILVAAGDSREVGDVVCVLSTE